MDVARARMPRVTRGKPGHDAQNEMRCRQLAVVAGKSARGDGRDEARYGREGGLACRPGAGS